MPLFDPIMDSDHVRRIHSGASDPIFQSKMRGPHKPSKATIMLELLVECLRTLVVAGKWISRDRIMKRFIYRGLTMRVELLKCSSTWGERVVD